MTVLVKAPRSLRLQSMQAEQGFVPSLNGLRAVSILIVFLSHTISSKVFPGGFGVRVFFLISGFLIARLLYAEWKAHSSIDLKGFYTRRFFRLYPVVIVYCAVVLFIYSQTDPNGIVWQEPTSALLYYANYYYSHLSQTGHTGGTMPFAIFWSLSVEEHFYIIFPIMFVFLRADPRKMTLACVAILIVCLSLRLVVATERPDLLSTHVFYYETQYQFDSIAFGVLFASLCEYAGGQAMLRRLLTPPAIGLALALLIAGFAIRSEFFRETLRYTLLSAAVLIVIVNVLFSEKFSAVQAVLNTSLLDWVGRLSYSIYVWHYAARSMLSVSSGEWWQNFVLWVTVTLLASAASYYLIEQPISEFRHRFGYRSPKHAATR